jgi:nicotinate-nucleotide pyrophosphorylase (carboxylating)
MPPILNVSAFQQLLQSFLTEDLGAGDVTTNCTIPMQQRALGEVVAKAPLVLAGIDLFGEVFRLLDANTKIEIALQDGQQINPGQIPARVTSTARALLTGERTALNLLQRLSGVATITRRFVDAVAGTGAQILDTRKTTPGLRALEKYAVLVGGGKNHRKDLAEAVLIKDNHVRLAGGVTAALQGAQAAAGRVAWIEVEVTTLEELCEALRQAPDVILLDNMSPELVRTAVEQVHAANAQRTIRTEASGGITLANVRNFAEAGVDWISVGALTHSAPSIDISFEIKPL